MKRLQVHHLGRAGDIAGGMTQVVNGYLAWTFEQADVDVITTRGDPHDFLAGIRHASLAMLRIATMRRRDRVVVAHLSERGSFIREGALLRLAHLRGIATVAHLHGSDFREFSLTHPALVALALRGADRVISLSDESSAVAARFVDPGRITLVPNAIPPGTTTPKTRTVVFGGVVSHRKGVDVLLSAWQALGSTTRGWRLLVAGPVRDESVVRIVPRAELLGSLPHDELMALLDSSRVAVLPSRAEAMPMFILEAMARRNCVVATAVGGVAEVLGEGRGMLIPPDDVASLTHALDRAIRDPAAREAAADEAFAAYEARYSAEAVFPRIEAIWRAAAGDARRPRGTRLGSRAPSANPS